jgi:hypothetical protein
MLRIPIHLALHALQQAPQIRPRTRQRRQQPLRKQAVPLPSVEHGPCLCAEANSLKALDRHASKISTRTKAPDRSMASRAFDIA